MLARRFWDRFLGVTFISQCEEDERLAEIERVARETLAEKSERTVLLTAMGGRLSNSN